MTRWCGIPALLDNIIYSRYLEITLLQKTVSRSKRISGCCTVYGYYHINDEFCLHGPEGQNSLFCSIVAFVVVCSIISSERVLDVSMAKKNTLWSEASAMHKWPVSFSHLLLNRPYTNCSFQKQFTVPVWRKWKSYLVRQKKMSGYYKDFLVFTMKRGHGH